MDPTESVALHKGAFVMRFQGVLSLMALKSFLSISGNATTPSLALLNT